MTSQVGGAMVVMTSQVGGAMVWPAGEEVGKKEVAIDMLCARLVYA